MEARANYIKLGGDGVKGMYALEKFLHSVSVEKPLVHLMKLRASQINGCAYCIDMHWKDLRALGQSEEALYMLNAWREAPGYTERERAALEWTEAVTLVTEGHVPDEIYALARKQFTDQELVNLTVAI